MTRSTSTIKTAPTTKSGGTRWLTLIREAKRADEGDLGQTLVRLARLAAAVHRHEEQNGDASVAGLYTEDDHDVTDEHERCPFDAADEQGAGETDENGSTDRAANGLAVPAVAGAYEEVPR